ncbi:MAG: DUF3375 family protein [bacterium]|nr:DUF3375 family protein [bacterium]
MVLKKSEAPVFHDQPERVTHEVDASQMFDLYSVFQVDKKELRRRVNSLLKERNQVSLKEVLDTFPLQNGLAELLTYFSLADSNGNHLFNAAETELIEFDSEERKCIEIPQIIFTR